MSEAVATAEADTSAPVEQNEKFDADEPEAPKKEPSWLKSRLDRERDAATRAALRELGMDDLTAAKEQLSAFKALQESKLSEEERLRQKLSELDATKAELAEYRAAVDAQAVEAMAALTDTQKAAVLAIAGDSPHKQIRAIAALKTTWVEVQPTKPIAPPLSTAPASKAPTPTADAPTSVLLKYEALEQQHPARAAYFYLKHQREIEHAKKARG